MRSRPPSLPPGACRGYPALRAGLVELTAHDWLRDRDISNNNFTELPQEITQIVSLEQLCAPVRPPSLPETVLLEGRQSSRRV